MAAFLLGYFFLFRFSMAWRMTGERVGMPCPVA